MKDIYQVLREKEQAVARLRREIEALRFCAPMLAEAGEAIQPPAPSPSSTQATRWPVDVETRDSSHPYQN
jgi:hypothetical protein